MIFLVLFPPGKIYDFMGMRKYFLLLSVILLSISAFLLYKPGPRWGTDFKGGTEVVLSFKQPVTSAAVREAVEGIRSPDGKLQFEGVEIVAVPETPNGYLIRVQEVSSITPEAQAEILAKMCFSEEARAADCTPEITPVDLRISPGGDKITFRYDLGLEKLDDAARAQKKKAIIAMVTSRIEGAGGVKLQPVGEPVVLISDRDGKIDAHLQSKGDQLLDGMKKHFPNIAPDEPSRVEWIGPKAGAELRDMAFKSIGVALFFIMAYIAIRFDLRFAPGAVAALIHDVVIAMGAMALFQKEISLSTVAAVLTIMGYSLTDTVVVYDRVRENLQKYRAKTFPEIVNLSVSEMFGRTIISSTTTSLSMLAFLVFGTQVIKDFAFAMLIGVAVGTYSSIYVAAPLTEWIDRKFFSKDAAKRSPVKPPRARAQKKADAVV